MNDQEIMKKVMKIEAEAFRFIKTTINMDSIITGFKTLNDYKKYVNDKQTEISKFIADNEEK